MSGAMVKLGVYGILRVGWGCGWRATLVGLTVLAIGAVSALFGILRALVVERPQTASCLFHDREHRFDPDRGRGRGLSRRAARTPLAVVAVAAASCTS